MKIKFLKHILLCSLTVIAFGCEPETKPEEDNGNNTNTQTNTDPATTDPTTTDPTTPEEEGTVTLGTDIPATGLAVGSEAATATFTFTANKAWSSSVSADWLSVSPASGEAGENISVTVTVQANENTESRSATVTVTCEKSSVSVPVTQEAAAEPEQPSDGKIRILAIGNSFSQDAVEQYLWQLFNSVGQDVIIGNLYIGGCTLETHYNNSQSDAASYYYRKIVNGEKTETANTSLSTGLADEKWDYISFQQASGSSGIAETYEPYLGNLITYVREKVGDKATLLFHQTWAYASSSDHSEFPKYDKDQLTMYNAIVSAVQTAMAAHPELKGVVPSGTAIQNGRTSWLGDTFNRDGYHLEVTYGRFTAACTWYETISGNSVLNTTWHHENIDDSLAEICRAAAHAACLKPWEITELTDYQSPGVQDPDFTRPVQIDFGAGSTATPDGWNRIAVFSTQEPLYLKNEEGKYASISITGLDGFTAMYNGVGSEAKQDLTINDVTYPQGVWYDGIMISGTKGNGDVGPAVITISGFDASSTYDLAVVAVRWNGSADARLCEYKIIGKDESEVKSIYPGLKNIDATGGDFSGFSVSFAGVAPASDGTIKVAITGKDTTKAVDGLINALTICKTATK